MHSGGAEDNVGGDAIQIVRADVELWAELFQLQHLGVERVARRLVAGERLDAARARPVLSATITANIKILAWKLSVSAKTA